MSLTPQTFRLADEPIVIVGAGHAGVQVAASLRELNVRKPIIIYDAQAHRPYVRPPLSKAFVKGEAELETLALRATDFFEKQEISLRLATKVTKIAPSSHSIELENGEAQPYGRLILATGARNRVVSTWPRLSGVHELRDLDDAVAVRKALGQSERIVIVGAGFIGLEFAATAALAGKMPTVVELAPRIMSRSMSNVMSALVEKYHREIGTQFIFGAGVDGFAGDAEGKVTAVRLSDGRHLDAELVLVGIGVVPNDALASAAGLTTEDGIRVDSHLVTSDPRIYAIGDCASFPGAEDGRHIRLESVQNALDQARHVAAHIAGEVRTYSALPWFWSDQGSAKIQIAGFSRRIDEHVAVGPGEPGRHTSIGFRDGEAVVVETLNRPGDHMAARRILGSHRIAREEVGPQFDLRAHAKRAST